MDFGPLAGDYDRYRVGYGPEVYAYVGERLAEGPQGPVLDLACGTGLSTAPLAGLARGRVVGADVARSLLARAPKRAGQTPLDYIAADATCLPLAGSSLAGITCAQALHWIPPEPVLKEAMRCLLPGGWFFAWWKYPHPDEPYQAAADVILSRMHGRPIRQGFSLKEPPDFRTCGFASFERADFDMTIPYTLATYLGFMRSRYRIKELAGERMEEFMAEYGVELERLIPRGRTVEERNQIFVFAGQSPGRTLQRSR